MIYSHRVEQAIRAAAILHKDQRRRGQIPLPYVTHLFATALIVADYTDKEAAVVAALLHDTLEDTDYTEEELREDFGEEIVKIVKAVSEPQNTETESYTWQERKRAYAKQLRTAPEEALLVAAADKIHNMRTTVEEYYTDHARFLKDFPGSLDERALMFEDISNTLNTRLSNGIVSEFNHVHTEYKNFISEVKKTTGAK